MNHHLLSLSLSLIFNIPFSGRFYQVILALYTYENVKALKILALALGFFTFSVCTLPSMMIITPSHSRGSSARYNRFSCTHINNIYPSRLSKIRRCSTQEKGPKTKGERRTRCSHRVSLRGSLCIVSFSSVKREGQNLIKYRLISYHYSYNKLSNQRSLMLRIISYVCFHISTISKYFLYTRRILRIIARYCISL